MESCSLVTLRLLERPGLHALTEKNALTIVSQGMMRSILMMFGLRELLWLTARARPELSFPVYRMSQWSTKRPRDSVVIGKGVLKHLRASPQQCLLFGPAADDCGSMQQYPRAVTASALQAYADASFGPQVLITWAGGAPLHWESGRQTLTALHSPKAVANLTIPNFPCADPPSWPPARRGRRCRGPVHIRRLGLGFRV